VPQVRGPHGELAVKSGGGAVEIHQTGVSISRPIASSRAALQEGGATR